MDELKLLIEMVAGLPSLMVWVLVGFLVYKIAMIGSIYGVIKIAIDRLHSWATKPKHERVQIEIEARLRGMTIPDCHEELIAQLYRLVNLHNVGKDPKHSIRSTYIHKQDIDMLREAIDAKVKLMSGE